MNSVFSDAIKIKIDSLKGNNFQNFIDELFLIGYDDYIQIKQKRDKGCDGIIENKIVIAAYAPEIIGLRNFKKKIKKDYIDYKKNWSHKYPGWRVVYNGEFTAERIEFIKKLRKDAQPFGIKKYHTLCQRFALV